MRYFLFYKAKRAMLPIGDYSGYPDLGTAQREGSLIIKDFPHRELIICLQLQNITLKDGEAVRSPINFGYSYNSFA